MSCEYMSNSLSLSGAYCSFFSGLSFLLSTGPADQVQCWQQLDATTRQGLLSKYHAAGIKVVASVFGSTETPTTAGKDPTQLAGTFASFIQQYELDGIDIDYEDSAAMDKRDGTAEKWLITFTQALRQQLPQGKYLLTHARKIVSSNESTISILILSIHSTCSVVLNCVPRRVPHGELPSRRPD